MKYIILLAAIFLLSIPVLHAQQAVAVDKGQLHTVKGIGGWAEVKYSFAKGDKVHLHFVSSKMLDRALAIVNRMDVLSRVKESKTGDMDFEISQDGIVTFHFVSDRGGVCNIDYEVNRIPASEDTRNFNTHVAEASN